MTLSGHDERLLHRFFDGALPAAEAQAVRERLASEPAWQAAHAMLLRQRELFAAAAADAPARLRPGFAAGVVAAVRRLPARAELREAELAAVVGRWCRRVLLAAAVLFGLGLLWQVSGVVTGRGDSLQASPNDVQREMDRLDGLLQRQAGAPIGPADGERRAK